MTSPKEKQMEKYRTMVSGENKKRHSIAASLIMDFSKPELSVHGDQEFLVVPCSLHPLQEEFHGFVGVHIAHEFS